MQRRGISSLLIATFTLVSICSYGQHSEVSEPSTLTAEEAVKIRKDEVTEVKNHHLVDDYSLTLLHGKDVDVSLPLPVILWEDGLHIFLSSELDHGHKVVESNGSYFKLHHGKIYKTDAAGKLSHNEDGETIGKVFLDFSITKNVVIIILMSFLIFFIFKRIAKTYSGGPMPKKAGRFLEPIIIFIRDEIAIPNIGEKKYKQFMGYLLTVFFFIWFLNLAGMTPLGIGVTNNIAVTLSLALFTFFITQFSGNKNYWAHIFWNPAIPVPMRIPLALIEVLGVFIKPFALMIRLFANMTAGHVVMISILGMIHIMDNWFATGAFFGLTLFLSILELLVAALQAYIFTMLTALYFGSAVEEHH